MYQTGRGVDPDPAQAVFWYQRAAAAGNARAQANLGNLYLAGIGVPQDNAVAANWFELAARQGHVVSQFNLGLMYENGIGVAVTRRRNSCWGGMYRDGAGIPPDPPQAYLWWTLASGQGHLEATQFLTKLRAEMTDDDLSSAVELLEMWVERR